MSLLLIDEASRVSAEMYRTARPMLAVSGGALWLMGTPSGRRGVGAREGAGWGSV